LDVDLGDSDEEMEAELVEEQKEEASYKLGVQRSPTTLRLRASERSDLLKHIFYILSCKYHIYSCIYTDKSRRKLQQYMRSIVNLCRNSNSGFDREEKMCKVLKWTSKHQLIFRLKKNRKKLRCAYSCTYMYI